MAEVNINPDFEAIFKGATEPYGIISVGIPGSQRAVYMAELARRLDAELVDPREIANDLSMVDTTGNRLRPREALQVCVERLLAYGTPVVIESHHIYPGIRKCNQRVLRDAGAKVVGVVKFHTTLVDAMAAYEQGLTVVPPKIISNLHAEHRKSPVTYAEGFDVILDQYGIDGESVIRL